MNSKKKTSKIASGPQRSMHVFNVGPCFTCGYRNVCWFAGMGWDKVNHTGRNLSDFNEPPCSRLKAVPTMPRHRGLSPDQPVPPFRKTDRQSPSTPAAGKTHRRKASNDSD